MKKTDKWIKGAAILALILGMVAAFLQSFHAYAAVEERASYETQSMVAAGYEGEDIVVLEDEQIPGAQLPAIVFPWWCWIVVIGAIAAGCGVYLYIMHAEKKSMVRLQTGQVR